MSFAYWLSSDEESLDRYEDAGVIFLDIVWEMMLDGELVFYRSLLNESV